LASARTRTFKEGGRGEERREWMAAIPPQRTYISGGLMRFSVTTNQRAIVFWIFEVPC
jgi:hypothetical protein